MSDDSGKDTICFAAHSAHGITFFQVLLTSGLLKTSMLMIYPFGTLENATLRNPKIPPFIYNHKKQPFKATVQLCFS